MVSSTFTLLCKRHHDQFPEFVSSLQTGIGVIKKKMTAFCVRLRVPGQQEPRTSAPGFLVRSVSPGLVSMSDCRV